VTDADPDPAALTQRQIDQLSVDQCLELLASASLGRVAFVHEEAPRIVPVNYLLHEGAVVFRTTYGTTLDTIAAGARVAFEVDRIDEESHAGWSVVILGKAEEIWMPEEIDAAADLPLTPWAPGDRNHYVRIFPSAITGRRIS
jgi:uncharacterized protein